MYRHVLQAAADVVDISATILRSRVARAVTLYMVLVVMGTGANAAAAGNFATVDVSELVYQQTVPAGIVGDAFAFIAFPLLLLAEWGLRAGAWLVHGAGVPIAVLQRTYAIGFVVVNLYTGFAVGRDILVPIIKVVR